MRSKGIKVRCQDRTEYEPMGHAGKPPPPLGATEREILRHILDEVISMLEFCRTRIDIAISSLETTRLLLE